MQMTNTTSTDKTWHDRYVEFLASISTATHGKCQYFEDPEGSGTWYSRISNRTLTTDEVEHEYVDWLNENV